MKEISLCHISELQESGSKGFDVDRGDGGEALRMFVVLRDGEVSGYVNSCPHTGAPLEWQEDQFLDGDGHFIQCAMHGALFDVADGRCLSGPCVGDHLQSLPVVLRDEVVYLSGIPDGDQETARE